MKRTHSITFVILTALLTGCVTVQPLPNISIPKGTKIGFISLVDEHPIVRQVGTTLLSNAFHRRTEDWGLSDRLFESLKGDLSAQGYELIKLTANDTLKVKKTALVVPGWDSFHLNKLVANEIEQYGIKDKIEAVIIFSPYIHEGLRNSQGGISGYGLLRTCLFGSCKYEPLERIQSIVATTKSPRLIGWDNYKPRPKKLDVSYDGDLNELQSNELDKAKEPVWEIVKSDAKTALIDAGLLQSVSNNESNK